MSNVDHILLYCLMLSLAYAYDYNYRKSLTIRLKYNNNLYILSFFLGLFFVFTEGLRYGRGLDQCGNYGPFYLQCIESNLRSQDFEYLFVLLNKIVRYVDITVGLFPYGSIFIVYALILWLCLWRLYKDYRSHTKCFLIFAIFAILSFTENFIRQGVSFSIIILSIHFLTKKNWRWYFISCVIAVCIHKGNIVSILITIVR